jgi:hypothetical protein
VLPLPKRNRWLTLRKTISDQNPTPTFVGRTLVLCVNRIFRLQG